MDSKLKYYEKEFRDSKNIQSTRTLINDLSGKKRPESVDEVTERFFLDNHTAIETADNFAKVIVEGVNDKTHTCHR